LPTPATFPPPPPSSFIPTSPLVSCLSSIELFSRRPQELFSSLFWKVLLFFFSSPAPPLSRRLPFAPPPPFFPPVHGHMSVLFPVPLTIAFTVVVPPCVYVPVPGLWRVWFWGVYPHPSTTVLLGRTIFSPFFFCNPFYSFFPGLFFFCISGLLPVLKTNPYCRLHFFLGKLSFYRPHLVKTFPRLLQLLLLANLFLRTFFPPPPNSSRSFWRSCYFSFDLTSLSPGPSGWFVSLFSSTPPALAPPLFSALFDILFFSRPGH